METSRPWPVELAEQLLEPDATQERRCRRRGVPLEAAALVASRDVRDRRSAAVRQHAEAALQITLDLDLPLPVALEALRIAPRYPELVAALEQCEFKGLLAEVREEGGRVASAVHSQGELF